MTKALSYTPSRFIAMSGADGENLVLFNSRTGALGGVPIEQAPQVKALLKRGTVTTGPLEDLAQDLLDGGFLIEQGFDEQAEVHQNYIRRYDTSNAHLIVMPTEHCNFRCTYCYESFERGQMSPDLVNGVKKYITNKRDLKSFNLSWFGGEPLLAPNVVVELTQFFHNHCLENDIAFHCNITTNASLLTPEIVEQTVPFGMLRFQITIDGIEDDHNERRIAIDGGASYSRIIENLRYLKSTSYPFVVVLRHNFDPEGLQRLPEFVESLKAEFGGDPRFELLFRAIGTWGGANDSSLNVCGSTTSLDAMLIGKQLAVQAGFKNALQFDQFQPNGSICYAANPNSFVVGADGALYKCTIELDYHERNIVGKLLPSGDMELDWRKMALWTETNGYDEGKKCNTCFFSPSCHGASCPKDWMDEGDCHCPPEKQLIRSVLPMVFQEQLLELPMMP